MMQAVTKIHGISVNSRNTYRYQIKSYIDYCKNNGLPENIDSAEKWIESAKTTTTANHRITTLKRVLKIIYADLPPVKRLEFEDSIKRLDDIKTYKTEKRTKFLTHKEVIKLCKNMPEHLSLIAEFMAMTGFRITPTVTVKLENCKRLNGVIEVTNIHKGKKEHTMPITVDLFKRIKKCFGGKVYLFEHHGKHYTRQYISAVIAKYSQSVIGKRISAHGLRHSWATYQLVERGVDITIVQAGLNHSNINTTTRYTHLKPTAADYGIKKEKK